MPGFPCQADQKNSSRHEYHAIATNNKAKTVPQKTLSYVLFVATRSAAIIGTRTSSQPRPSSVQKVVAGLASLSGNRSRYIDIQKERLITGQQIVPSRVEKHN